MSGNMYANYNSQQGWQSDFEGLSLGDNDSQFSESGGVYRPRAPDLGQRLRTLLKDRLYTDVKFVVNCGIKPKPELYAHKAILAIGSPEFAKIMFGTGHSDSGQLIASEFEIKNVPFEALRNVVEYLYTDDVYFEDHSSVMQTMMAARKFQVQSLVNRCESYFETADLTEESACITFQLAIENKIESMKNRCSQFIQENTPGVIRSKAFRASTLSTVRSICKLPKLNLRSEEELFEAVLQWIESQPGNQSKKRELIQPLLKHIRFSSLPAEKFSQLIQKRPDIFTAEEALNIVVYLANPTPKASAMLPTWFNKGGNRCFNTPLLESPKGIQDQHADRKVTISLRPIGGRSSTHLMNVLEMKCLEGTYDIKALKLTFGDPVLEYSSIDHMVITVSCAFKDYKCREHLKIKSSKEIVVTLSKRFLIGPGETVTIRADANEVKNYRFLQFDEENSFGEDSPFQCSLGSIPKENRLFFINEVIYRVVPGRRRRPPPVNYQSGRKMNSRW